MASGTERRDSRLSVTGCKDLRTTLLGRLVLAVRGRGTSEYGGFARHDAQSSIYRLEYIWAPITVAGSLGLIISELLEEFAESPPLHEGRKAVIDDSVVID